MLTPQRSDDDNHRVGIAVWLVSGGLAVILARIVPAGRPASPALEIVTAWIAALGAGLAATALDFGGWAEPDWRAGLFAFFVAAAALGVLRMANIGLWKKV